MSFEDSRPFVRAMNEVVAWAADNVDAVDRGAVVRAKARLLASRYPEEELRDARAGLLGAMEVRPTSTAIRALGVFVLNQALRLAEGSADAG